MIMRQIITTDEPWEGWVTLKLACGHEVGPLLERRAPKKRKRCLECERIATHRSMFPSEHRQLMGGLQRVPMDDRATVLVDWINHLHRARQMICLGIESYQAILFTEQPTHYPLWDFCFDEDEEPSY